MNLTPRSYLLAALVAGLGIVEQWTSPGALHLWRIAAALLVVAFLHEWLRIRGWHLTATAAAPALALGRRQRVTLEFRNGAGRPLTVVFAAALPAAMHGPLEARRIRVAASTAATTDILLRPTALGEHAWPAVPVRLLGPLGLGWWFRRCRLDATLTVTPDVLRLPARSRGSAEGGGAERPVAGAGAELHHLRAYRRGDPRHTIDWNASARCGSPITRVYAEDQHLEIMVVVDAGRTGATDVGGLSQLGHFVNAAARFAERAAALDDRVGLVVVADRLLAAVPPRRGRPGVLAIRRHLAGLEAQPVETDMLQGALEVRRLVRHRALVVMLTDLFGQDTGGRLAQSVRLLLPRHLPVAVGLLGEEVDAMAHQPARRWIDPYVSLAAHEYRTGVWRNAAALRRQGAHTVVTVPDALDAQVLSLYRTLRTRRRV